MASKSSSNGKESSNSKITASVDSLKLSSKTSSKASSKRASSESVLSKKEKESLQMQECKKKLLEPQVIIRDENVVLHSPPQKSKIVMPPVINPEELAASTPTERNWRGILIALLVIAAVLGLIVFSIALLTPPNAGTHRRLRRPTVAQLLQLQYTPFNGTWVSDTELVLRDHWGHLTCLNVRNLTTTLLVTNSTFRELNAVDFKVSADLKYVLLLSDVRAGWRHGRLARYHVYDVVHRNKVPLSPVEEDRSAPPLQYAEWAPQGSGLVFVHDNDLYYKPRVFKTLVCRITSTGVPGVIFNGVPDFLYETEVLRLDKALWFSPDGQSLLYVSYNDSQVQEHKYTWYGLDQPEPPVYPTIRTLRYPKVNTNNPVATVYVVSLKTPKFLFPHALQLTTQVDHTWYVRWSAWSGERQVVLLLLNRPQTVSQLAQCSATGYTCQDIYRDESDGTRWSGLGSEPSDPECGYCGGAALIGTRSGVYSTAPTQDQSGIWRHAVKVGLDGKTVLTQGNFEITQLVGWDEKRKFLYVMGTAPERPGERHLYRVPVPAAPPAWPGDSHCLTCPGTEGDSYTATVGSDDLDMNTTWSPPPPPEDAVTEVNDSSDDVTSCLYNRVTFSTNYSYFVQECLGPGPPSVRVVSAGGERGALPLDGGGGGGGGGGRPVRGLARPRERVFRVQVQENRSARVRLLLPPEFRENDDLPLPLVLRVSCEPGAQQVTQRWSPDWGWYLAATRHFIVAEIDGRGAAGQGEEMRTEIYQKLMAVDVEDQLAVLSYLRDNLKMVDGSRVGVWGQGYGGGAAAALAAGDGRNVTRCLAIVAPVTDLSHYISYWTERYAGHGAARLGALSAAAPWRRAGNLPPRPLLLAHGTADTSRQPSHALSLAAALVRANALYTHQVYPDEGHRFERSQLHLYKAMEQFFDDCFGPVEVADWESGAMGGLFPFRD